MIREARPEDLAFVRSGWLRSYASSDWATLVSPSSEHTSACRTCGKRSLKTSRSGTGLTLRKPSEVYWHGQRALIDRLIAQAMVIVAENEIEGLLLLDGFVCWEPPDILHYVYVRDTARRKGIAKELCGMALVGKVRYTHRARAIVQERIPAGWEFSPYLLMGVRDVA